MTDSITRERPAFAMIPEALLDSGVSGRAVQLYALLDRYAGENGKAYPAISTMSERLSCSPDSTQRAIAELVEGGWLEVVSGKAKGKSNHYVLLQRPKGYRKSAVGVPQEQGRGTAPMRDKGKELTKDIKEKGFRYENPQESTQEAGRLMRERGDQQVQEMLNVKPFSSKPDFTKLKEEVIPKMTETG